MLCKKCGAEISDDSEFCPVCRSSVNGPEMESLSAAPPPAPVQEPTASEELPPVEPEDYSAGAAEPVFPDKPAKKWKMGIAGSVVIAVLFGILSLSFSQTAAVLCTISGALSSHAVSEQIADLDIGNIEIGSILPDDLREQLGSDITDDISEIVSRISDGAMSKDEAAEIIRRADISREIAKIAQAYEDFIATGKSNIDISSELERIINGAKDIYSEVTGKEVPDSFDSDMANTLRDNAEILQEAAPQAALGFLGETFSVVFSPAVWIVLFVLSAVCPLLVWGISRRAPAALMCGGAAYLISGLPLTLTGGAAAAIRNVKPEALGLSDVIEQVLSAALEGRLMVCGIVMAAVGAAMVIAFIVIKVTAARKIKA